MLALQLQAWQDAVSTDESQQLRSYWMAGLGLAELLGNAASLL
jgi:hypothetical protein